MLKNRYMFNNIYYICFISYCENFAIANKTMWDLAKKEQLKIIQENPNYNFYLCTEDIDNEVILFGIFKNWFLNYEKIFGKFNCYKIHKHGN